MIIKSFDLNKINPDKGNLILFYGKNDGQKNQFIKNFKNKKKIFTYEEKEILDNSANFIETILTKSLFEDNKLIIIKRVSDKILKIIEEISSEKIENTLIILKADALEKKSKLRSYFEKNKNYICVPFYPDDNQTLSKIALSFFKDKKITISQSNINLIVGKCSGDREVLYNELEKIYAYSLKGNKINTDNITKLINLLENHSISELVDNCLAKDKRKIIKILNENNFNNEDCVLITRTFLNKTKKILILTTNFENNKNINLTISSAKPPIFWKDKEIIKKQIILWNSKNLKKLLYNLNYIEFQIKKNFNNSLNLVTDFILEQASLNTNN